jgi:hypothetical protein
MKQGISSISPYHEFQASWRGLGRELLLTVFRTRPHDAVCAAEPQTKE